MTFETCLNFYQDPGMMTDPRKYANLLKALPDDIAEIVKSLQGCFVQIFWAERYGLVLDEDRKREVNIHPVWRKLRRIMALDPRPLTEERPLEKRLVCNSRDISVLLAAALKTKGIPARARCGFGTYFHPKHFEDHWVVECWLAAEQRWVQVDAQLDEFQINALAIQFNPLDLPQGAFVLAGQGWLNCRKGVTRADDYGTVESHGMDFIRGNLVRDLCALNSAEALPSDVWGVLKPKMPPKLDGLDEWAHLTLGGNELFERTGVEDRKSVV